MVSQETKLQSTVGRIEIRELLISLEDTVDDSEIRVTKKGTYRTYLRTVTCDTISLSVFSVLMFPGLCVSCVFSLRSRGGGWHTVDIQRNDTRRQIAPYSLQVCSSCLIHCTV